MINVFVISSFNFPSSLDEQSEVGMTTPFMIDESVGFLQGHFEVYGQNERAYSIDKASVVESYIQRSVRY